MNEKALSTDDIIRELRLMKEQLQARYGVSRIGVFVCEWGRCKVFRIWAVIRSRRGNNEALLRMSAHAESCIMLSST